jgi:hypothetical protein
LLRAGRQWIIVKVRERAGQDASLFQNPIIPVYLFQGDLAVADLKAGEMQTTTTSVPS